MRPIVAADEGDGGARARTVSTGKNNTTLTVSFSHAMSLYPYTVPPWRRGPGNNYVSVNFACCPRCPLLTM
eukprot:SAG25_NODE_8031_length_444_cov_0.628986_1_plen_70_part_10